MSARVFMATRVILTALVLLLGCGTLLYAGGSAEGKSGAAKGQIDMLGFYTPSLLDANDKAFAYSIELFRKAHPAVTVNYQFIQHDNYELKLKTMAASKTLPDVYISKPDLFPLLKENGIIASMSGMLSADAAFKGKYKDGALNDFTIGGEVWALPFQLQSNSVVYYNQAILEKSGVPAFPSTMEGLLDAAKKIRAAGYIPIVVGTKGKWLVPSLILNTMVYRYTDGSEWFDKVYNDKGATFNDAPFVDGARLVKAFVDAGAFNDDLNSIDNNQQRQVYYSGKAAMFIEGSWALGPVIENASPEVKKATKLAILPQVGGNVQYATTVAGGAGWGICMNAQVPAAKKDGVTVFLKEVWGQEYANEAARNGGFPAMVPTIDMSKLDPLYGEYTKLTMKFAPIIDVQFPAAVVDSYYNDLQDMLIGSITPEQYAAKVEAARLAWIKSNK